MSRPKHRKDPLKQTDSLTGVLAQQSRERRSSMRAQMEQEPQQDLLRNDAPPTLSIEYWNIEALKPPHRNVRNKKPEQVAGVRANIREFDFIRPILITREGEIVDGVVVLEAATQLGYRSVPCIC